MYKHIRSIKKITQHRDEITRPTYEAGDEKYTYCLWKCCTYSI